MGTNYSLFDGVSASQKIELHYEITDQFELYFTSSESEYDPVEETEPERNINLETY